MSKKKSPSAKTAKLSSDARRKPSPLKLVKTSSPELDATESVAEGIERRTVVDRVPPEIPRWKLDDFLPLQGKLKKLTEENYIRFRDRLLARGFRVPLFVWADRTEPRIMRLRLLDGHQRTSTLRRMRDEGFTVPAKIAAVKLEARDEIEAKDLLLSIISQFGEIDKQGLFDFMKEAQLEPAELETMLRLPELNAPKFVLEYWPEKVSVSSHEKKRAVAREESPKEFMLIVTCKDEAEQSRLSAELLDRGFKLSGTVASAG